MAGLAGPGQAKSQILRRFNRQVILRGVGHAALHNPGEVNLCAILRSSIVYDRRLRDRTVQSKQAKKSSKRWKKVSANSMPDARIRRRVFPTHSNRHGSFPSHKKVKQQLPHPFHALSEMYRGWVCVESIGQAVPRYTHGCIWNLANISLTKPLCRQEDAVTEPYVTRGTPYADSHLLGACLQHLRGPVKTRCVPSWRCIPIMHL